MVEGATYPAEGIVQGREVCFHSHILTHVALKPTSSLCWATSTEDIIRCLAQCAVSWYGFLEVKNICQPLLLGHNPSNIIITLWVEAELMVHNWHILDTECIWTDGSHMEDHMGTGFMREVNGTLVSSESYLGKCHGMDQRLILSVLMPIHCMYIAYVCLYSCVYLYLCIFATCLCTSVCAYCFLCLLMPLIYAYVYLSICLWVMILVKEFSVGLRRKEVFSRI
jgi:hypothetical protein